MNSDLISLIQEILESEDFETIQYHTKILTDIEQLFDKNKAVFEKFIEIFTSRLLILKENGINVVSNNNFEPLKQTKGLFRFKINVSNQNIRVIYSYKRNGEILLHCFYERDGKKSTGYSRAISIAQKRLKEFKEEQNV